MPASTLTPLNQQDSQTTRRRILLPGHWVRCSSRTIGGRFSFSEFTAEDGQRVTGLLIAAMQHYGVEVSAFSMRGNTLSFLAMSRRSGRRISLLNQYLKAGIARLVHARHGTSGPIWRGPFVASNLLDDAAELACLIDILRCGVDDHLVADPALWPLPNTVGALQGDGWIRGLFPDRDDPSILRPVEARLSPLTAWRSDRVGWQGQCRRVVEQIVAQAAAHRVGALLERVKDHTHVPELVERRAYVRVFEARGVHRSVLQADAYAARRQAIVDGVQAVRLLVREGGAEVRLPERCQWPAFVADALDEPFVEVGWAEVYGLRRGAG
jgi:hypothetical protein